jgi:hypothetical protein
VTNVNSGTANVVGLQIAGALNLNQGTGFVAGAQVAVLGNVAPQSKIFGLQVGLYNRADRVYGFQVGVVNYANALYGIQVGLLNINEAGPLKYFPVIKRRNLMTSKKIFATQRAKHRDLMIHKLRAEKIDYITVRKQGTDADHHALAKRTFDVLKPLFGHLADKQYNHYLDSVVRDPTAVIFRGIFLVDENRIDRGLTGVRIGELSHEGRTVAHLSINVGLHPEARGEYHTALLVFIVIMRYRLRHPMRPFFFIDTPVSAASYCKLTKIATRIFPTPDKEIPESLWPICESVAKARGWKPIEGCPKEARSVERPLTTLARIDNRRDSEKFSSIERWFSQTTAGTPGSGVLVITPLSFSNVFLIGYRTARGAFQQRFTSLTKGSFKR